MSNIAMQGGSTGTGTVTLLAPVTNTNRTINLPDSNGTIVTSASTAVVTPAMLTQPLTLGTAVASTSGTSIDFNGIPSWVKRVTVMLSGVSTNGTSVPILRLGTSSGIEATGYLGATSNIVNGSTPSSTNTTGLGLAQAIDAAAVYHGQVVITLITSNLWAMTATLSRSDVALTTVASSSKTLSGTLDRVRITTVNGTDAFDAGSINILYEG
jgi:hypothetical protein